MNLVVDPCPDSGGNHTIRWADGSECGDTNRQPVATVYDVEVANSMVAVWNQRLETIALLRHIHAQSQQDLQMLDRSCSCHGLMGPPCCPVHG
jgi:hypothetical protein